jgi:hypothetical protein
VRRLAMSNEHRALMESRRPLMNVIELKEWSYFLDESHRTEIRVSVVIPSTGPICRQRNWRTNGFVRLFGDHF